MATTAEYGLGEFTFPRGWFMVGESSKITDKPQGVKFFGQEFAQDFAELGSTGRFFNVGVCTGFARQVFVVGCRRRGQHDQRCVG